MHVALAVASLCVFTALSYGLSINYWLLCFVFFSTVVGYNFAKYFPVRKDRRLRKPKSYKFIKVLTVISILGLLASCFFLSVETILVSIVLCAFNFFYAMPLPHKTLREIPFLKVFIIAFIWTAVTFGLPFIESATPFEYDVQLYFEILERFCWILLLLIPFEIRDYNYDRQQLKTLATVFGVQALKIIGAVLASILIIMRIVIFGTDVIAIYSLIYFSLIAVIVGSKKRQPVYYSSFWVEGLPLFWLVSWLVIGAINYSS